jgi:hypothetical protein
LFVDQSLGCYCSEANLAGLAARPVRGYVATGRQKHSSAAAVNGLKVKLDSLVATTAKKLKRARKAAGSTA